MIVAQLHLYPDYKVLLLPAKMVGGAIGDVRLGSRQFLELMDEWYGSDTYQDEKLEMTRLFEERLGEESAIDKSLYRELREKHPDAVILFRLGEFYEIHGEEAEMAADVLGLPATRTDDGVMVAFPYRALDTYLPKLVRAGKRVAICDQLEEPKLTKKHSDN